jgi:cell wall-associated NlpC family hydrolase
MPIRRLAPRRTRPRPHPIGLLAGGLLAVLLAGCGGPKRVTSPPPTSTLPAPPADVAEPPAPAPEPASTPRASTAPALPRDAAPRPRPRAGLAPPAGAAPGSPTATPTAGSAAGLAAASLAQEQIGKPYRFGGRTPTAGFDCSGLAQYVYGQQGIDLPRTANRQAGTGRHVDRHELEPGDLVFFRIGGGRINHVGVYAGDGEFIHAPRSGKLVQRESLGNPWWRERYAGARRVR